MSHYHLRSRLEQLDSIVQRRNDLLRELFILVQTIRQSISLGCETNDSDLQTFLERFDLNRDPNQGSIANFKEEDFSFPDRLPLQPSKSDFPSTPSHIESVQTTTLLRNEPIVFSREDTVIPIPLKPTGHVYHFDALEAPKSLELSISPVHYRQQYDPQYKLPPLSVLPAEFSRKTKTTKRKKERERDKSDGKKDKDEALPMGVSRWGATVLANPVWKKVSRATKCLSSREWGVAMTELRLIRTFERIESLKDGGRWSFRQPKKQRGIGGLVKTHWDYLMDEMKWMRIDFREERRWKMATAYDLSTAVLEWHSAGTPEQRLRTGICVKWQPSFFGDDADGASEEMNMKNESHQEQLNPSLLGVDYGSEDDDDDDDEQDKVIDALEPATPIKDSMDTTNELRPKDEEVDDQSALRLIHDVVSDNTEADQPMPVSEGDQGNHLSNVGAYLKNCDIDISTILQDKDLNVQLDFATLFPDLQPLGLLDVHPCPAPSEGKKKMEKRSDKDDPNKRIEDTTYTKLHPTGRFMYTKPTLLGPLQPSKHWKNGRWLSTEETSIVPDEGSGRIPDDSSNELFDGRWGSERKPLAIEIINPLTDDHSVSGHSGQMTTRGVKRLASASISSEAVHSSESKRRRRHVLLQESMRRASKKRAEAAQKLLSNQRKAPAIHETHNQYNKLPKLTPMDLSRMKAEKDARDGQDLALARQRLIREQTQRVATIPTATAQQPQSTSQPQPQPAQQVQPPLAQQQLQHQHTQIPQLHQIQAQQQAIQSQRSTGASSTIPNPIPNRSAAARLSAAVNARPLSQQGQHLQQGRGVQVSVPLQAGAQASISQQNLLYGLPSNFTQEQLVLMLAIQTAQAAQQQQQQQQQPNNQASPNGFITQS